ncbi:hypothetical protein A2274_00280 [candidate division WWE3 bacterium RIFOXYA12_FULL_43_11]|nr:MAG: hypothetical protein UR43_C0017G0012 [candidate division TM6 bacterium GW2011_GWF2_33_332]KKS03223.1 MAG: hypothetical protein UU55_C0004G0012 [candidate division WWE3 bacterium GW2011_GWC2_41_23]OGC59196.1 MAG: hypothetical protein A2245_00335 [candidate division WWE3 bacterium RIFOXYA2_FULL_43_12]OGC65537.1 MAG: hypothetical protein A2274_00280 [candidate division WWE3 bacterium RIFOXYA12_FULL_43_11]HLD90709.1 helix-turn-helix transcriptional regulator [Patescibacteria group bacterium
MIKKELLGRKIKEYRLKAGKSQDELGRFLGKSHAAISDLERGVTEVTVKDLSIIAEFLGVALETLLEDVKEDQKVLSFSPLVNYRDSKDMTSEEKSKADKVSNEFIKFINDNRDDLK